MLLRHGQKPFQSLSHLRIWDVRVPLAFLGLAGRLLRWRLLFWSRCCLALWLLSLCTEACSTPVSHLDMGLSSSSSSSSSSRVHDAQILTAWQQFSRHMS